MLFESWQVSVLKIAYFVFKLVCDDQTGSNTVPDSSFGKATWLEIQRVQVWVLVWSIIILQFKKKSVISEICHYFIVIGS